MTAAHPGEGPLASGRTADVFALDDRRVLRRYRDGLDATAEAAVMAHVAAHGYPVPAVLAAGERAPRTDLVLERVSGPTMLQAVLGGGMTPERAGATLAGLLRRLHRVPARRSPDPRARVLHLDLHPDNVILGPRGPVVIDWANATDGEPGYDRAVSALILAEAAVGGAGGEHGVANAARAALAALLDRLHRAGGGPGADWGRHCARAAALRAANPTLDARERELVAEAELMVRGLGTGPAPGPRGGR